MSIVVVPITFFHSKNSKELFFIKRSNDLEIWLREKGYSVKLVQKQTLKLGSFQ